MTNEALIIRLIQQDMKHHQLLSGLEQIQLYTDGAHYLQLMELIAELMNVPSGQPEDAWYNTYLEYMNQASDYPITSKGEELMPLATQCFQKLSAL